MGVSIEEAFLLFDWVCFNESQIQNFSEISKNSATDKYKIFKTFFVLVVFLRNFNFACRQSVIYFMRMKVKKTFQDIALQEMGLCP